MRIAVTGGAGFIGAAVVKEAESRGNIVWRFDRSDGHNVLGSLEMLKGADVVIHLAGMLGTAELFDDPFNAISARQVATRTVLPTPAQPCITRIRVESEIQAPSRRSKATSRPKSLSAEWRSFPKATSGE